MWASFGGGRVLDVREFCTWASLRHVRVLDLGEFWT